MRRGGLLPGAGCPLSMGLTRKRRMSSPPISLYTDSGPLATDEGIMDKVTEALAEALPQRVEEALRRADAAAPTLPNGTAESTPWALAALAYLDRRQAGGATSPCPLSELFKAVSQEQPELTVTAFHDGLRRLHDRG